MWTEPIETNLDIMRQNINHLKNLYMTEYNTASRYLNYINIPLVMLSALNAYAVYEIHVYGQPVIYGSSAVSALSVIILGGNFLVGVQNKITDKVRTIQEFDLLEMSIVDILAKPRDTRIIPAQYFQDAAFEKYDKLVSKDKHVTKFKGSLKPNESQINNIAEMHAYLIDHWNIIFRPELRKIKTKNAVILNLVPPDDATQVPANPANPGFFQKAMHLFETNSSDDAEKEKEKENDLELQISDKEPKDFLVLSDIYSDTESETKEVFKEIPAMKVPQPPKRGQKMSFYEKL